MVSKKAKTESAILVTNVINGIKCLILLGASKGWYIT